MAVLSSHGRQANDNVMRAGGGDALTWAVVDSMRAGGGDLIARPAGGRRCGKSGWWTIISNDEGGEASLLLNHPNEHEHVQGENIVINKTQTNIELTSPLLGIRSENDQLHSGINTKRFHISTSSMQPASPDVLMTMVRGCIYLNIALTFGRGRRMSPCSRPSRRAKPTS